MPTLLPLNIDWQRIFPAMLKPNTWTCSKLLTMLWILLYKLIKLLAYLVKMWNSVVCSDAVWVWMKSMVLIEYSTLLFVNKVLLLLVLVWPLTVLLLLLKSNSVITSSPPSINLSTKLLSTDSDLVINLTVVLWPSELLGVLLVTVLCITLNLRKLTSPILLVWRLSFPEIPFNVKVYYWPVLEIRIPLSSSNPRHSTEMLKLRFLLKITNWISTLLMLFKKVLISPSLLGVLKSELFKKLLSWLKKIWVLAVKWLTYKLFILTILILSKRVSIKPVDVSSVMKLPSLAVLVPNWLPISKKSASSD